MRPLIIQDIYLIDFFILLKKIIIFQLIFIIFKD